MQYFIHRFTRDNASVKLSYKDWSSDQQWKEVETAVLDSIPKGVPKRLPPNEFLESDLSKLKDTGTKLYQAARMTRAEKEEWDTMLVSLEEQRDCATTAFPLNQLRQCQLNYLADESGEEVLHKRAVLREVLKRDYPDAKVKIVSNIYLSDLHSYD